MSQAEKCEICGNDLFSVTVRRFGDHSLCRDCGDGPIGNKIRRGIESLVINIIRAEAFLLNRKRG